jgi:transcriptional regulator with XRE-family HTH domain
MLTIDLKTILNELGISQTAFARLIGVTPRAVTLWMMEDRSIPGPVEAYAKLLASVPLSIRQVELNRLKERKTDMRDGMYGVEYKSVAGAGQGVLILDNGRAFGADPFGGKYDGEYIYNEGSGLAELRLKLTFAPNASAVFGISNPYEWSIDVTASIDPRLDSGKTRIATPIGPHIEAEYRYLRALPDVA